MIIIVVGFEPNMFEFELEFNSNEPGMNPTQTSLNSSFRNIPLVKLTNINKFDTN